MAGILSVERSSVAGLLAGRLSVVAGLTAGGKMVFVKVRETYDLHTVQNKMTVIGIHTPKPDIIKANFPGLLMQCKAYRPVSADVKIACASVLPLDPQGVGLAEGDVAPEDVFNPILYKACSNFGMSQIEARIAYMVDAGTPLDVDGKSAGVSVNNVTNLPDEFPVYYGFLSNAHGWKHANPQSGLSMKGLRPLVYEMLYNIGDNSAQASDVATSGNRAGAPAPDGTKVDGGIPTRAIRGNAKPLPFLNCTAYSTADKQVGFPLDANMPYNHETDVPWINCVVGAIIVPPSRLHELFYRMVVEWTIEFSAIRPVSEITDWTGLGKFASITHYQNYSYEATKEALTGSKESILESDSCMVSANVDVEKVM